MRTTTLIILAIFIFNQNIFAQKERWTVKAGEETTQSIPDSIKFLYPHFATGFVHFKDGKISRAPLNYNLLVEEIQFISTDMDTLSIADEATIKLITINNDSFYYDKAYLQTVTGNSSIKLAKKESLKIADVQKMNVFNQPSSTASTNTVTHVYRAVGPSVELNARANIVLVKQTSYYIGDKYNHFRPATKRNVLKMFSGKQPEIENFLNKNKITFNKEDDLMKLVNFLQGA